MPEGATTGLVVVTTAGGQSSNSVTFTVTSAPTGPNISKLEPDSAPVGTEIKIKGSNFGTSGSVTFNGTAASTNGWNDKKIQAVVPSTATDGPVVVTVDGESSNGVTFDVTAGVPSISKLEPDSGPVLTQVKIKGSNFGDQQGTVTFNGVTHDPSRWNHNIIHAQVPQGATTGPVVVTTSAGRSSAGVTFTVPPSASRPIISRLDPEFGTGGRQRHHRGFQFRVILGNRHLQRNHRFDHQLGQRRDSDKCAVWGHLRAGGGEDLRWTVERRSLPSP